jgi:uncharacterized protein (TIGR03086 family)
MTDQETTDELALFPAPAPEVFLDAVAAKALLTTVFDQLAGLVTPDPSQLGNPTPCDGFDLGALRNHVLGWLQFFAAALADPAGETERIDPTTWELGANADPAAIVHSAAAGAAEAEVVMSEARMLGGAVLAMALGEYLVHGWDLATATDTPYLPNEAAAGPALEFLRGTVVPEYRGPDSGFFGDEVPAPENASVFEQLLCFAGRNPFVQPSHGLVRG